MRVCKGLFIIYHKRGMGEKMRGLCKILATAKWGSCGRLFVIQGGLEILKRLSLK